MSRAIGRAAFVLSGGVFCGNIRHCSVLTSVQLFRHDRKLTACALGEPSLTLVRNDSEFGLLVATGAHEDSFTSRFYLDNVFYLRITDKQESYTDFNSVAIFRQGEIWLAQDTNSGRYF